ncbi:MAG: alpha/beta fold hydrolase, partial [Leptospira sp.]|nr:alpha/beta fold hydrolase [Leptospira sp.]
LSITVLFISLWNCRFSLPEEILAPKLRKDFNKENIPIVFVPGIKGSRLFNKEGEMKWLTGSQALGLSNPDLRLHGSSKDLIPMGPVDRVTAIPYLLDASIYYDFLKWANALDNIDFYVFSYDWRKDNLTTRNNLEAFLQEIGNRYNKKPVLIGHSMGGMLSFSTVNKNPDLVSKAVYVGTPFRGGIGYMRDLLEGVKTGINSRIQSPCVIAKYESVYVFFPRLNTWETKNIVLDKNGKPMEVDFFKAESWDDNSFGFHSHTCKPDEIPNPIEFQRTLTNAKKFRQSLDPSSSLKKSPLPSLVISAKNRDTTQAIQLTQDKTGAGSKKYWDLDLAEKVPGDGRVTESNSVPPPGFEYKLIYTEYEHSVMLNDSKVQREVLEFLQASFSAGEQN